MNNSNALRVVTAVLAGAQILVAGSILADVVGPKWAALAALVVAAAQAGTLAYKGTPAGREPEEH